MSHIGQKIKKLRKNKALTLAQVAQAKMSPAMLSMIENGKSKPSADNLNHIARTLQVDIGELLGGKTRGELQHVIDRLQISQSKLNLESIENSLKELKSLLPKIGHNIESATIYELYANYLFFFYTFYKPDYFSWDDNDWEKYFKKAEAIFSDLQMEPKVLGIHYKLAQAEYVKGNYQTTIDIVDNSLSSIHSEESLDTISNMIGLKMLKVNCLEALGNMKETFHLLHEIIRFSNKHLVLNDFFMIHNFAAMLYYQNNDFEIARKHITNINAFFQIIENNNLFIEKEIIMAHYTEFFEDNPSESLIKIDELEKFCQKTALPNEIMERRIYDMLSDLRARCYTKLNQPKKALPLFRDLMDGYHMELHPTDIAIRIVNQSYQSLCYMQLNDRENALKYATEGVKALHKYPRTAYYHFAKNVQRDVLDM